MYLLIFSFLIGVNTELLKTEDYITWGSVPVLFGMSFWLDKSDVFFEEPLISSDMNKPYETNTIPSYYVSVGAGILALPIIFLPTRKVSGKNLNYQNIKAYTFSIAFTTFITAFVKNLVGRRRPDYNSRLELNKDLIDGKKSFFSGHSSVSFAATTYFSLFLLKDAKLSSNKTTDLWLKIPFVVALNALSSYVAYTRVSDNKHHVSDVLVGGAVGSAISVLSYYLIRL